MTKKIGISMAFFLLPLLCFSQATYFGVHAGGTTGWFSGNNWDDYVTSTEQYYDIFISETPAITLNVGIFFEKMFSNNIGIVSEINYTSYGQDYSYTYSGIEFKGQYRSNAFELPLLIKLASSAKKGIYVVFGPSLQFLIGDMEFEESGGGYKATGNAEYDNSIVIGAIGGIGYRTPISTGVLTIDVRYGRNITYAFDESDNPFDANAVELLIGYGFTIKQIGTN